MQQICFYHAGCPDGFGAAWSVWRAWKEEGRYVPRGHEHTLEASEYEDAWVTFVDIAPQNDELLELAALAARVTVLDHHVTARDRYLSNSGVVNQVEEGGHEIVFDLQHSGAVLAWNYFSQGAPTPDLLRYVEDQDLWNWQLPDSAAVNAAIAAYPHRFETWDELSRRPIADLAAEGESIVRANRMEVERVARYAHPISIDGKPVEAVNATQNRSAVGHELAERRAYGVAWSCVYRVGKDRVHATLYSIGDVDVASIATTLGGGGHHNAAGFSVSLEDWVQHFVG